MKKTFIILGFTMLIMSCTSPKPEATNEDVQEVATIEKETTQTSAVSDYMTLKDAFVKSDATAAKAAASALSQSLEAEHMDAEVIEAANLIASSDDLKGQRAAFKTITDGLILALKADKETAGVYVQYCPMAFGNTGANWLSMSEEILNPYFGAMMLKCGRVEEEI
ncbi:MAG: hypothetical protein ACI9A7_002338 [Cyclobacteriaceae bacterium]|jgi:hypothetical protein